MNGFPFIVSWLREAALSGSVVILLLLVLRPLIRRWLGARAVHALWLVVLVRLLIPWTPQTPMAVLPAPAGNRPAMDSVMLRSFVGGDQEQIAPPTATPERHLAPSAALPAGIVELIWLAGAAGVFSVSLVGASRAAPLVRRAREIAVDSAATRMLASLPRSVRGLRILETDELKSPALCGFIRPAILLPPGWAKSMAPDDLRCVLLHEIGHHRRADVLWRWMFLLARAIHWFNPLVWMAERAMRIDQEMACDEWVLAQDGGIDSQKYGEALLRACKNLTPFRMASPGHSAMAESSAGLARRIRHIARMRPHGWPAFAGTAALAAGLCVIGPSPGTAQAPARVIDETPANPRNASAPPSAPSSTPPPLPDEKAKNGNSSAAAAVTGAPTSSPPAKAKVALVEIETKFVKRPRNVPKELAEALPGGGARSDPVWVLEDPQFQVVIRMLSRMKGADLLSAPRVTCKSGQRAVMEMIHEFRYPTEYDVEKDGTGRVTPSGFETRNVGLTLGVIPTIGADGRIDLALTPSVVEFGGFVNFGAGRPRRQTLKGDALTELMKSPSTRRQINQPIFNTRTVSTSATIQSGQTVIVGGVEGFNGADAPAPIAEWKELDRRGGGDSDSAKGGGTPGRAKKGAADQGEKYLLIFVTARIMAPEGVSTSQSPTPAAQPASSIPQPPPSAKSDLPAAVAVPDKPGFVTSPYAPKAGFIDVRGFAAGTEIQCPYTGKPFVIP